MEWASKALRHVHSEHFWNVASSFICRGVTLVLFAIVVRHFVNASSPEEFADASLLLLVFSYVQLLDLGIGYAVTQRFGRAIALTEPNAIDIIRAALPLYMACATVSSLILFSAATPIAAFMFNDHSHAGAVRWLSGGVWAIFLSALMSSIMQAHNKIVWVNASRTVLELVKAAGFLIGPQAVDAVGTVIVITIAGAYLRLCVDVALAAKLLRTLRFLRPVVSGPELARNLIIGWPMIVALVLGIVNTLADRIFVSRLLGAESLARYTIAYEVNSKAFFLVGAVSAALYTPILRRAAVGLSQRALLLASLASVALVALLYFVPLAAFSEPILSRWINPQVGEAASTATRIGALMGISYLSMSVLFNLLQASGRSLAVMLGTIIASTVIVGGLLLMPRSWDAEGAIAIVALGFFAQLLFYAAVLCRRPQT